MLPRVEQQQNRVHGNAPRSGFLKEPLRLAIFLLMAWACAGLTAQNAPQPSKTANAVLVDPAHPQDWITDIGDGWRTHQGDDPSWDSSGLDDSAWQPVQLDDQGPAQPGWRWYRIHLKLPEGKTGSALPPVGQTRLELLPEGQTGLALLLEGGEGAYALYIDGVAVPGPAVRSSFHVSRPSERVVPLSVTGNDVVIALRTHTPPSYAAWHLPLFMTASLGTADAIESQRQALQSERLYSALPSISINLLLIMAGLAAFALHRSQRERREYLWLGVYLFLQGTAQILWGCQQVGLFPLWTNFLLSDPLTYAVAIAQIEFTFGFGGQRVGRSWRVYEALLLAPLLLIGLTWQGHFSSDSYVVVEGLILVPVAVLLPIQLLVWYRRGNREAGWLILPSLLPAATVSTFNLGTLSIFFGWRRFDFLDNPIQFGPIPVQPGDIGDLLFLLAIAVVMFFRFTRVSREQARTAAELGAAREIQQRLVPASLPALPGFHLEAAYLPAQEVGGDFYQVLEQPDGAALIVVGDVSGKGLRAAMTGALAIGALRTLAAENHGPAALLDRLNRQMLATQESGFITCLCLCISPLGAVTLANAGHLSPYRRGDEIEVDSGLPLGLAAGTEYSETTLQLEPGDTLTLLSDGVVEAMNPQHQLLGFERARALSTQSAHAIAAAAQAFGQEDDITVLTIARLDPRATA
jgi:hypothetical protein